MSNSTAVTVASGATLAVNGFTDTIATLAGAGTVDFGSGGTLIAAGAGSTTFSGDLAGSGTFTKQGAGILTLTNDLTFAGTFNLAGGTLQLSTMNLVLDTLNITGNSIIDFAGVSTLALTNFSISGGVTLTVQNWANASDYFFTQFWTGATLDATGAAPMNQITFTGFPAADTKWQSYDRQVTPVPEPSTYGALLLATAGGLLAWRRRIRRRAA
ncbi:autotransporter-associated beta strand repeat-containing protein [Lacunisphaera limnophila]|uniref:autotransporter-associated beta strand repeat-containing protein n=1 Tax=Lacunisphaera limnophila TaxID=1838286 RepID=UPI0008599628|nr:autotransporter-associated beta strand repeat-containing protein [Lacunisphaera limnophila]